MNNIITALNKAFLKLKPSRSEINEFKANFKRLFTLINDNESEEYNKNLISDFLKDTYYKQAYFMNTKESVKTLLFAMERYLIILQG